MSVIVEALDAFIPLESIQSQNRHRFPFLLQSVARGHANARFDILFACPQQQLVLDAGYQQHLSADINVQAQASFLDTLDHWWQGARDTSDDDTGLPFRGGWFLYLGYELANEIEPILNLPEQANQFPTAFAVRIPAALINDSVTHTSLLVIEAGYEHLRNEIIKDLTTDEKPSSQNNEMAYDIHEEDPSRYLSALDKVKRYIRDGDVFQVNLSRAWLAQANQAVDASVLYQQLCRQNPAPFAGLVYWHDSAIVSSSPERLLEVRQQRLQTKPIAGTYPRDPDPILDQQQSHALLAHPKERAEHIMLIDLERNDIGRVCKAGSVQVDALMEVETFAHVHHIVSTVSGHLREGVTPGQVIRALFPGGTITGCPKVRCMQIIQELEQCARGPYTGSMGYLNHNGDMDLNILIRTLFVANKTVSFRAGAGLVHDSQPQRELDETRAKAKGLIKALETRSL